MRTNQEKKDDTIEIVYPKLKALEEVRRAMVYSIEDVAREMGITLR